MRVWLVKKAMEHLESHPSRPFQALLLQILLNTTARAFGRKGRLILFSADPLKAYGLFSRKCIRQARGGEELYGAAYRLGAKVRRMTGLTRREDLERLVFFLYSMIGIDMSGSLPGTVVVTECFFSRGYRSGDCQLISAMDSGLIAGLFGGGSLTFEQRITQGYGCCQARFQNRRGVSIFYK